MTITAIERRNSVGIPLTARQLEVVACVHAGLHNKGIAKKLGIALETAKEHLKFSYSRLGVDNRTQAALWYERNVYTKGKHVS